MSVLLSTRVMAQYLPFAGRTHRALVFPWQESPCTCLSLAGLTCLISSVGRFTANVFSSLRVLQKRCPSCRAVACLLSSAGRSQFPVVLLCQEVHNFSRLYFTLGGYCCLEELIPLGEIHTTFNICPSFL
jgi:hypothetical protein